MAGAVLLKPLHRNNGGQHLAAGRQGGERLAVTDREGMPAHLPRCASPFAHHVEPLPLLQQPNPSGPQILPSNSAHRCLRSAARPRRRRAQMEGASTNACRPSEAEMLASCEVTA